MTASILALALFAQDAHHIEADDWFVSFADSNPPPAIFRDLKVMKRAGEESKFFTPGLDSVNAVDARYFWKSRVPKRSDLAIGLFVIFPSNACASRAEAIEGTWTLSRIVGLDTIDRGEVLVAGLEVVKESRIRLVEGTKAVPIKVASKEDRHFLHEEHWLVWRSEEEPPSDGTMVLSVALCPEAPHYIVVSTGKRLKTSCAFRTRPAAPEDLQPGARVAMLENTTWREKGPGDRDTALRGEWIVGTITKITDRFIYIGEIGVSKGATGLRIVIP